MDKRLERILPRVQKPARYTGGEYNQIIKDKTAEYEKLRTSENLTATEQERLKALAKELQSVLGDEVSVVNSLTGEYNDLSAAIENYVEQQTKKVKFNALEESATEAYKKIEEIKQYILGQSVNINQ